MRRADNLTTFMCRLSWNLGASTSWNPQGLSRPVMGLLYLLPLPFKTLHSQFGICFSKFLDRVMYKTKFPIHISVVFSKFNFLYQCNFFFDVPNISFVYDQHCHHFNSLLLTCGVATWKNRGLVFIRMWRGVEFSK